MSPAANEEKAQAVTPEQLKVLLSNTDWSAYTRRVVEQVAKKAEEYKEANAKSLEGAAHQVFM